MVDWCCMCKCGGEIVDRLLIRHEVAQDQWSFFLSIFGGTLSHALEGCGSWFGKDRRFFVWNIAF